ncbi:MAG TPA: hypothetical protein VFR48_08655 [Solirubrobacteraceae bacterium]|nr:hypothetical protein [Solirubrobacteraceae bacterium]
MTEARVEKVHEDRIAAREYFAQAERFFVDATRAELSADTRSVVFHNAAICACDAILQAAGLRVTSGEGSHLLRLGTALEQVDGNHDDLLERLDESRWHRNNVSYQAGFVPDASVVEAREATTELIELTRGYVS